MRHSEAGNEPAEPDNSSYISTQEQELEQELEQNQKLEQLVPVTSSNTNIAIETSVTSPASSSTQTSLSKVAPLLLPFESDNWTTILPYSEHNIFFQETNWAASHLGPLAQWSSSLRQATLMVLADSRASCLYWGPYRVAIYNEAFVPLAGKTHPTLMSATFQEGFPEICHRIQPVFDQAESTGLASVLNEVELFVERNNFLEQAFFSGNFVPLRGNTGNVEGFYNAVHEVTKAKINERRRIMLNGFHLPPAEDNRSLASHILPMLNENPWDFPMALLYKVDDTTSGSCSLVLSGNIGFPEGHPLAVEAADISSDIGLTPLLRKARWKILTVPIDESFDGITWAGFGEPSRFVSVIPISDPGRLYAFLVIGSNPRRPVDDDYHQFMQDLGAKFSSIASSILSAEETRKREASLERELADRTRQISYMAENASVGMQYIKVDGSLSWANDEYYRLTEHPRAKESQYPLSFIDVFVEEDKPKAIDNWERLVHGESSISTEMRLKRVFHPPVGDPEPAIVLIHSIRVVEEGRLKSVMAFTTDVSAFRWAEASEARKATAAQEAKRQQEEFIDFVSHELRNPLSAIFQLAETIITSFPDSDGNNPQNSQLVDALKGNIDNAETILMCAKHQKRIVDDVLTLSKLDYTMLSVSPLPVQVPELVEKWMKMFESQLLSHHIILQTKTHPSLQNNYDDWILCDESRVQQIFINLMTNAIKFTKEENRRKIKVEYGVTSSNPRDSFPKDIKWAPNHRENEDLTEQPEWGLGEPLYFTMSVTDTGIGMTGDEIKKLFGRFKQANARTSIKYGGSGLGLFLSERLAEKQSGEIGVSSQVGQGSTFAFYIKSRRTEKHGVSTPENPTLSLPIRSRTMSSATKISAVDFSKIHVLLVEDNLINQKIVQKQLLKAGCVVYLANHGLEALDMLRESDIWSETIAEPKHLDIILMDWQMPVMDGLECSREIGKLESKNQITRHVEIIATTANARDEQIETAMASGIDSVMSKPFLVSDLLVRMKERLSIASTDTRNTAGYSFWE